MDRPTTDMSTGIPKSPEAWEWREYADYLEAENAALVEAARAVVNDAEFEGDISIVDTQDLYNLKSALLQSEGEI